MENRFLCRAKRKNWSELPRAQWWVEGYYVELPVGNIAKKIVSSDNRVVCEDTESYIISIFTKQHSNYSPGSPLEIVKCEWHEIDPETVCQYTGLTDKNGKKIWEGDVVGYWDAYSTENGLSEADCVGKVVWDDETMSFQVTNRLSAKSYGVLDECSVIGNVFDNPELLEVYDGEQRK